MNAILCIAAVLIWIDDPKLPAGAVKILEAQGFRVNSQRLVHSAETDSSQGLRALAKLKSDIKRRRREFEQHLTWLEELRATDAQARNVETQLNLQLANARTVRENNQVVGKLNALNNERETLIDQRKSLEQSRDAARAKLIEAEDAYIKLMAATKTQTETALQAYAALKEDEKSKAAVIEIWNATEKKFKANTPISLEQNQKKLIELAAKVREQAIAAEVSGDTLRIPVVLGSASQPVDMVVDSGASVISLPYELALSLGIKPDPTSPELKVRIADGSLISARTAILPVVRIGPFEAKNVDAAILGPEAVNAEPLLGMSFLGRFNFSINMSEKSLLLREVSDD